MAWGGEGDVTTRRFLVIRKWGRVPDDELPDIRRRLADADERDPEVRWDHSHVVRTSEGEVQSYCIHLAASPDLVEANADLVGGHAVQTIRELGEDARPADFVPEAEV